MPSSADPGKIFITGASSGLGAALARRYAREGAVVGLVARNADPLEKLAAELGGFAYPLDVRDHPALHTAALDFMRRFGVPDTVIACAGVSCGNLTEYAEDLPVLQAVMDINLIGMAKTFQPFLRPMREAGRGTLAGIASVAGFRGLPGASAYSASKAAAISYLESLRVELHGSGIQVVTLCPGYIQTPMTAVNPYPMPFMLTAEEAARLVARAIAKRRKFVVLPWQMALVGRVLEHLPIRLYDRLFAKAQHKPRNLPIE